MWSEMLCPTSTASISASAPPFKSVPADPAASMSAINSITSAIDWQAGFSMWRWTWNHRAPGKGALLGVSQASRRRWKYTFRCFCLVFRLVAAALLSGMGTESNQELSADRWVRRGRRGLVAEDRRERSWDYRSRPVRTAMNLGLSWKDGWYTDKIMIYYASLKGRCENHVWNIQSCFRALGI